MYWIVVLVLISFAAFLFGVWLRKQYDYWENLGVTSPGTVIFIVKMIRVLLQIDTPADIVVYAYDHIKSKKLRYGGCYFLFRPIFVPVDPELIKKIFVKDFEYFHDRGIYFDEETDPLSAHLFSIEGAKWRSLRTQITAAFSSGKLKNSFRVLTYYGDKMVSEVEKLSGRGPVEVNDLLARFNSDVIATAAFGININSLEDPTSDFHKRMANTVRPSFTNNIEKILAFIFPDLVKLFRNVRMVPEDIYESFFDIFGKALSYRENGSLKRNDLMEVLTKLKKIDENNNASQPLSSNELAAQAFVFFFTGIVPPTTVGYFCLYELAANRPIMERLRGEIGEVARKHNGGLTYEALAEMTYLDKVILETMRKYPVLPNLNRVCTKDYKVPDSDLTIKAGTKVVLSVIGMHHNEDYFENAEVFNPDRFSESNGKKRHPFTFLPFGKGPRMCIGE